MDIMITSKNKEMFWADKFTVSIGTMERCDLQLDIPYEFLLTIKYDFYLKNYIITNAFQNPNILFCHKVLNKLELGQFNKIYFKNSDEFLTIRILERSLYAAI